MVSTRKSWNYIQHWRGCNLIKCITKGGLAHPFLICKIMTTIIKKHENNSTKKIKALQISMYNQEILFHDKIKIRFNKNGIGEVEATKYDEIIKMYSSMVADENYTPELVANDENLTEEEKEEVIKHKQIALREKENAKHYRAKQKTAEEETKTWKNKVNELLQYKRDKDTELQQKNEEIKSLTAQNKELSFKVELWANSLTSLKEQAVKMTDNHSLKTEKNKGKIIDIIIKNL